MIANDPTAPPPLPPTIIAHNPTAPQPLHATMIANIPITPPPLHPHNDCQRHAALPPRKKMSLFRVEERHKSERRAAEAAMDDLTNIVRYTQRPLSPLLMSFRRYGTRRRFFWVLWASFTTKHCGQSAWRNFVEMRTRKWIICWNAGWKKRTERMKQNTVASRSTGSKSHGNLPETDSVI